MATFRNPNGHDPFIRCPKCSATDLTQDERAGNIAQTGIVGYIGGAALAFFLPPVGIPLAAAGLAATFASGNEWHCNACRHSWDIPR